MSPGDTDADPEAVLASVRDAGPDAWGWLGLGRRGTWLIRGAPVTHPRVRAYLAERYGPDEGGAWFVQNGPQRVWVTLETAPLIVHLDAAGGWCAHTGKPCGEPVRALLDEDGGFWLATPAGPAWVEEGAFAAVSERLVDGAGRLATAGLIEGLVAGAAECAWLECDATRVPVEAACRSVLPALLGFDPDPRPPA